MKTNERPAGLRVLLVEDSAPVRRRLRSLLEESLSVDIVGETGTVAGAVKLFHTALPDAVVLDLILADGNAAAVFHEIRRSHSGCMIIVLTNCDGPECRDLCQTLGAHHFFNKSREFERVPEVLAGLQTKEKETL